MSPTALSLRALREAGFFVAVVERWIPHANVRRDCYGWADLLACHPDQRGARLIQVTTASNLSARVRKAKDNPALLAWIRAGGKIYAHGWRKKDGRWILKERMIRIEDVAPGVGSDRRGEADGEQA